MSLKTINIQDDQGKDCPIRDIRAFQKHLQLFHRTGVSVHDEDGHYFTRWMTPSVRRSINW